jgi:hypothetical protein
MRTYPTFALHAGANCGQEAHDHEIIFGEDLRASPPKRTREIMIHQGPSRTETAISEKGLAPG